jgi:2-polyprenyl-3-methyl-5-hydroxy-6-metoxy-1,4-benzoquinol methylase
VTEATETIAAMVLRLAGDDLSRVVDGYRWLCKQVLEESYHFRRTGRYRLSSFADAEREVYSNFSLMRKYMDGQLLTQVMWANHTSAFDVYLHEFLSENKDGYRHLEVGPGHGMLLSFALQDPRCESATGWDVSDASLTATREALERLGVPRKATLSRQDVLRTQSSERFDSIVISEVCEHLEDPRRALECLRGLLAPRGRIFVNVPANSPSPDHIYLLDTPEQAVELVKSSGFEVSSSWFLPATGHTLERARKAKLAISCVVIGTVGDDS